MQNDAKMFMIFLLFNHRFLKIEGNVNLILCKSRKWK